MSVVDVELHEAALVAAVLWAVCTVGLLFVVWRESQGAVDDARQSGPPSDSEPDADDETIAP